MTDDIDGRPPDDPVARPEESITLDELLARAARVADAGPNIGDAVRSVLRDAVPRESGEAAHVIEVLAKTAGLDTSTVRAMFRDERCRFGGYGVVAKPAALAAAWLDDAAAGPEGAAIVYTEGSFFARFHDPQAQPFYQRLGRELIEQNLASMVPHHPLVERCGGRRETVEEIARLCSDPDFFAEELPGLQMRNGFVIIDMETGNVVLKENDVATRSRWVVDADYDEDAECPVFAAGLARIMQDDQSRASLLEKFGAAATGVQLPGDNANSITILLGPPLGGKSTAVRALEMMVPAEMRTALQPADMGERFMAAALEGKRLNLVTELATDRPRGGPVLKAVTSRETITIRPIRERPRQMTSRAAQVFVSNEPPHIQDRTGAYMRRISAYRLDNPLKREEIDPGYMAKIGAELPGIVALVLHHLSDAVKRGYFLPPTEQDEVMAEMRRERDVVSQAIAGAVVPKRGARLTNQEVFQRVREFAAAKGVDLGHLAPVAFGRRVAKAMREHHRVEPSPTKAHGGVPFYEGVAFAAAPRTTEI